MAFVRLLKDLMRDKEIGQRIVPIIPDEARTFGMDSFFPTLKIYNPHGQNYTVGRPRADAGLQGVRARARSCTRASTRPARSRRSPRSGTSYATHGEPMIPIYIFYSMFGFQRTGDAFWAAADQMARGFVHRRHGRPHDADRRGPAARRRPLAAARRRPTRRSCLRPGVRLRDRAHRAGRPAPDVRRRTRRTSSTTSPSTTSRTCSRPSRRTSTSRACCAGMYLLRAGRRAARDGAARAAARLRRRRAVGARGAGAAARRLGRRGRRVVGDVVERAAPRRRCAATSSNFLAPRARTPRAVRHPAAGRAARARSSRCPTTCAPCRTRSASGCRATSPRWAPTASASPTPARPRAATSTSTARRWRCGRCSRSPRRGEVDRSVPLEAARRYRLSDVTAGTSGNEGGDS